MAAKTKSENGFDFPAEAYAYAPDANDPSTWKVRLWETPQKKVTRAQVGRAMAAIGKGFRGNKAAIPATDRAKVVSAVKAAWIAANPASAGKAALPAAFAPQKSSASMVGMKEAVAEDFLQVIDLVTDALDDVMGVDSDAPTYSPNAADYELEAIYADRAVIEKDGRCFSYPYTIDAANQVKLGAPQEVIETYTPVTMAEATGDFIESADPEGRAWDAVLIRSGLSKNGTFYPDAVLREAVPLFEGARVLARSDEEHLQGKGKSSRNIVGWISGAKFIEGAARDTGRVAGVFNFGAGATELRETVTDAWKRGKKDLVGLSIDAAGSAKTEMRESQKVRVAKSITKVNSVDLIVDPGAGGALVRLVEANNVEEEQEMKLKERMLEAIKAKKPKLYATLNPETITDEALEAAYREALTPEPAPGAQASGLTHEQVNEQIRMVEARANMRATIAGSKLPVAAQAKLQADFAARAKFTEAEVGALIKAERAYIAGFTESGKVALDAAGDIVVEDRSVKIRDMFDAFFDQKHKNHRAVQSFKECYIEMTGDRRVTGRMDEVDKARMREALGERFAEALDSTSFGYVLGDSITRRMVAEYNMQQQYDAWKQIATTTPVQDFRTQDRTLFGGYGDLPAVVQGAPYASLASPTDQQATYGVTKRGGTEDITMEMIKNDDVGAIRRIPVKLARSAKRTLAKFVFDFIRNNPLIYDGVAFFDNAHNNLGTTALSAAELGVARRAMLKQTELNSGDRMAIPPKSILVPIDLQESAWNIFQRSTNLDKTFIETMVLQIIPVWYWTDVTDWAIAADPADLPGIEIGFLDGQEEPELFVQDMPNVGSMFSNDKLTYKIRHIYGGNVLPGGEKAFYKEVVAG